MSTTIRTMPTVGERAIITRYGYQTPATFVGVCDDRGHIVAHWCYDEPTPSGATWTHRPDVAREPITEHPMGTDIPRPERVTLSDEEVEFVYDWSPTHPDTRDAFAKELAEFFAAREQALRNQIAGEIEAANASFGVSEDSYGGEYGLGVDQGLADAAHIARGETR